MKKLFAFALALTLLLGLAACDWSVKPLQPTQQPQLQTTLPAQPETTQPVPEKPLVRLYLPNDNADGFIFRQMWTDGTIEELVSMLVAEGALPEGCAPLSFDRDGARLDMNEAFGLAVSTTGTTGEYMRFGCLVNTVLTYYGLENVYVTAGGRVIESGHAVYDEPLGFFENQAGE